MGFFGDLFSRSRSKDTTPAASASVEEDLSDGDLPCRAPNMSGNLVAASAPREPAAVVKARIMETRGVVSREVAVDQERCQACGHCVQVCPDGAVSINGEKTIDPLRCTTCGCCVPSCPHDALSLKEEPAAG